MVSDPGKEYDAIILAVMHKEYQQFDESYFASMAGKDPVFIDIKGIYKNSFQKFTYWSL